MGNFNSMQTFPSSPGNRDPLQTDMNDVTTNGLLKKSHSSPPERHSPKATVKDMINHVKSMPNNSINNALYGLLVNKNSFLDNMEGHHQHQQQRNSTHTTNRETPPETNNKRPMSHHHHTTGRESQCSSSTTSTTSVSSTRDDETIRNRTLDALGSRKSSEESLNDLHSNTTTIAAGDSQKQDVVDDSSVVHKQAPVPPKTPAPTTSSVPFNPKKRFIQRYEDPEPTASAEIVELSKERETTTTAVSAAAVTSTISTSTTTQSSSNNKSHHQASTATAKPAAMMASPNGRVDLPPPETGKQQKSTVSMRIFLDEMMAQMVRTPLNELEMPKSPTATAKEVPVQKRTMTQYDLIQQKIRQMLQDEDCGGGNMAATQQQQQLPKLPPPPLEEKEIVTQNAAAITPLTLISAQIEAVMRQQPIEDGAGGVVGKPGESTQSPHHHHRGQHQHQLSSPQDNSSSHSNGKEPPGKNSGVLVHGYPQLRSHLLGSITKGTPRSKPQMDEALLAEKRAPKDTVYSIITNEIKQRVFNKETTGNNGSNSDSTPSSTDTRRNTWSFPNRAAAVAAAAATTVVPPPLERKILGNSPHRPIVIDPSPLGGAAAHHQQHHLLHSPQTATTGLERPASYHGGSNQGALLDGSGKPGSPSVNRRPSFSKNPLRDAYFGKRDNVGKFRLEGASPNRHVNTPHEDMRLRAHTVSSLRPPDMCSPPHQQQQSVGRSIPSPIQHPHQHPSSQQPSPHHQHHRYTPYPTSSKSEQHFPIRAGSVDNKQSQSAISLGKKFPSPYVVGGHHIIGREVTSHQGQGQHTPLPSPRSIPPQQQQHPSEAGRRSHGVYEKQGYPQQHQHQHHTHHGGEELGQKNVVFQQGPSDAIRTPQPVFSGGSITAGTPRSAGPILLEKQRELLTEAYEIQSCMSPPRHQQHQAVPPKQQAGRVVRPPSRHEFEKDSREGHLPSHLHLSHAPYLHSAHATQTGSAHTTPPVSQSGVPYQFEPVHMSTPNISIGQTAVTAAPPPLMPLKDVAASIVRESMLGPHSSSKPDVQYRARSRSPPERDRARGFEVEPNNRQPRGGDLPLDLSSRKEGAEPNARGLVTSATVTHHPSPSSPTLAPASILPHHHNSSGPGPKARPDFGRVGGGGGLPIDSSIYQEEWLKSYILPQNADKARFAERSQTLRNDPSEPQKPHLIISTSHDITSSKPSEVARQLPAAATLDISQPTDYLVATAQMAYSGAAAAAAAAGPYGLIYGPMAFGLKPAGVVGPTTSEAPSYTTTKQQHVSQPIIKDNNTVQSSIMDIDASANNNKQASSYSSSNTTTTNSGNKLETKMRSLGPNLLGDHPADDVLSLDCSLCRANYGNVHSFIRHFHRDHSKEGEPQRHHVGIRSIMKAKHDKEVEEGRPGGGEGEMTRLRKPSLENIVAGAAAGTTNKDSANIPTRKDQVMNCLYCNQEFPTRDWGLFRKHMRSHDPHQPPSDLAAPPLPHQHHQQNQYQLPLFRCSECRLEFRDAEEHLFHAALCHRNDRGCMCRVCHGGESFAGVDAMYRHIHTVHDGLSRVEVEYCCLDCGKSYSSERELYSHWHQTHRYFHGRASSSPGPHITLAVRTRVRDQGVATMSPPAAASGTVHRVTPDTTCKEGNDERETSSNKSTTKDQDQALSAVSRYNSGGLSQPSKGSTIQEKMLQQQLQQQQPPSKSKTLSYLEFLEQKVEEEHHKQADGGGVSNATKGAGTGTTAIIPRPDETVVNRTTTSSQVGKNILNKRHHEEEQQQAEVVVGKVPRLDIATSAAEFTERREMATVDSKITEIITNTLAEKKVGGGGSGNSRVSADKDSEETSLIIQNENRMMRALMTTFLKKDVDRILSALQEQQGDAVRGGGSKHQQLPIGTTDPLLLAAAAAAHHQQQEQNQLQQQLLQKQATNRSDITDSDIIDATVLAGISGGGGAAAPPKAILHHPLKETSNTDKQNSLDEDDPSNGSCPPKLESLVFVENNSSSSSSSSRVHARSPLSDGGGIANKNGVVTGSISSDTDETEALMPVLEAEKPTADLSELKEEETLYRDDSHNKDDNMDSVVDPGVNDCQPSSDYSEERRVGNGSMETVIKEGMIKGERTPPPKSLKKRVVLERVDSFEEPPLVIDMDNDGEDEDGQGSVRNDSASDVEEDTE